MPRKKSVNENFFKIWTPQMAYVLGFFFADGSYDLNSRGGEYMSFQVTDRALLYSIRNVIQSNHKISKRERRKSTEKPLYRLQIGSKAMCADLRRHGVATRKSLTAKLPNVPIKFFPYFLRGYFDGDGNVWTGLIHQQRRKPLNQILTAFTSASKCLLDGLRTQLGLLGTRSGSLFRRGNAYRLQYSAKDSIILYHIIYKDCLRDDGLCLLRKKSVFEAFLEKAK